MRKNKYHLIEKNIDELSLIDIYSDHYEDVDDYYYNYFDVNYNYNHQLRIDRIDKRRGKISHNLGSYIDMESFYSLDRRREIRLDYLFGNYKIKPVFGDLLNK
jgi:DUF4097 and DUF4098 domain-containing protein YvlB